MVSSRSGLPPPLSPSLVDRRDRPLPPTWPSWAGSAGWSRNRVASGLVSIRVQNAGTAHRGPRSRASSAHPRARRWWCWHREGHRRPPDRAGGAAKSLFGVAKETVVATMRGRLFLLDGVNPSTNQPFCSPSRSSPCGVTSAQLPVVALHDATPLRVGSGAPGGRVSQRSPGTPSLAGAGTGRHGRFSRGAPLVLCLTSGRPAIRASSRTRELAANGTTTERSRSRPDVLLTSP